MPVLSQAVLADKPVANAKLGRAKALIESGPRLRPRPPRRQWAAVTDGHRPTMTDRGALWLAASHAGQTALEAIELLYSAAGADAIYATSALDRCLRDARTAVQHICTQESTTRSPAASPRAGSRRTMASRWIMDYRGEGIA